MKEYTALKYTNKTQVTIYLNFDEWAQIKLYWCLKNNCQKKPPKWRDFGTEVYNMSLIDVQDTSFTVRIKNKDIKFNQSGRNEVFKVDSESIKNLTWLEIEMLQNIVETPVVKPPAAPKKRGRPKLDNPKTPAQRMKEYRARKKAQN